jgi:hypothetical protein
VGRDGASGFSSVEDITLDTLSLGNVSGTYNSSREVFL